MSNHPINESVKAFDAVANDPIKGASLGMDLREKIREHLFKIFEYTDGGCLHVSQESPWDDFERDVGFFMGKLGFLIGDSDDPAEPYEIYLTRQFPGIPEDLHLQAIRLYNAAERVIAESEHTSENYSVRCRDFIAEARIYLFLDARRH